MFKIATFNVNSVRARLEIVLDWLDKAQPDALCLQETKVQDAEFPVEAFEKAGWRVAFSGEKSYNGVAIVSKEKAMEVKAGFSSNGILPLTKKDNGKDAVATLPMDVARLIRAKFGKLHIVNTYVPQGRELDHPMYPYKLAWFGRLRELFEREYSPRKSVVWVGDLNVAPEPLDVDKPENKTQHVCYHEDVRKAFAETCAWGFVDVFRMKHPGERLYSFFDYRNPLGLKLNQGWRVDHILATKPLAKRARSCEIDLAPRRLPNASDHTVMWAEFD